MPPAENLHETAEKESRKLKVTCELFLLNGIPIKSLGDLPLQGDEMSIGLYSWLKRCI